MTKKVEFKLVNLLDLITFVTSPKPKLTLHLLKEEIILAFIFLHAMSWHETFEKLLYNVILNLITCGELASSVQNLKKLTIKYIDPEINSG